MGGCLPVAQMSAAGLFGGDVLVHDGLQGAVSLQLFQNGVDSVLQRRVLCHADGVVFLGVAGIQDLQAGVGSNELLGGSVVDSFWSNGRKKEKNLWKGKVNHCCSTKEK